MLRLNPLARGALSLSLVFCASFAATPAKPELPRLTVGTVFPMSGPQAAFGKEALRGINLASELLAKKDPELATRITIVSGDDLSTAKDAAAAAEKLAADRTHLMIGSLTSAASAALAEVAKRLELPLVSPLASQTSLVTGTPVFRSCFNELQQAEILAAFALTTLGAKQAATLRDDSLSAQAFATRFAEAFKAGGGQILGDEVYDLASEDYTLPLKKLEDLGAKFVATPANYQTSAALMRQAKKLNTKFALLGGESWDTDELGKQAGAAARGHYYVAHFAVDDPDPTTQEFVAAFTAKFHRPPGAIAALTYDAFNIAAQSFNLAKSNMKGPLTQAILKTHAQPGATGSLTFLETGTTWKSGIIKQTGEKKSAFKARIEPLPRPS